MCDLFVCSEFLHIQLLGRLAVGEERLDVTLDQRECMCVAGAPSQRLFI